MSRRNTGSGTLLSAARWGTGCAVAVVLTACSDATSTQPAPATLTTSVATPVTTVPEGRLPRGRYALQFHGADADALVAEVDVPTGFETWNGNVLWAAGKGSGGLMFWTVDRLPPDPCRAEWKSYVDPGPSVQDLADALLAQQGRTGSQPKAVSVEGYDGLYLEFRVPKSLDVETCVGASYDTWRSIYGIRYQTPPGSRDRIWILDVHGDRLVINLVEVPGNGAVTKLRTMFDSIALVGSA